jgi:enoyl-CoA hydratase/carnithine racemase
MDTPSGPPTLTREHGVVTLRLNRPQQHNRLEPDDLGILEGLIVEAGRIPDARALVLTAGGRSFSAGYDLDALASGTGTDDVHDFGRMVDALETCRLPTLAVLNGSVYGGGTDLALACDIRIGVAGMRMLMPASRFGLHYYHGGLRRYATRLGLGAAKRLFLLGEPLETDELLRIGYLDEVLPDEAALRARGETIARLLADAPDPGVIQSMKRALNRIAAADMDPAEADAAWAMSKRSPIVTATVAAARAQRAGR